MSKSYYTLIARDWSHLGLFVAMFGDYDPDTVKDERDSYKETYSGDDYTNYRIISTDGSQDAIDAVIDGLNH